MSRLAWLMPALARLAAGSAGGLLMGALAAQAAPLDGPGGTAPDLAAYAKLPICTLSADGKHLAVEPCRTAPARKPMPRRPVPQIIQRMPPSTQARQVSMPAAPPSTPLQSLLAPPHAPLPLSGCDAGGCYDPSGVRHNNAAAGSTLTPAGKLCNRNGVWLQCP